MNPRYVRFMIALVVYGLGCYYLGSNEISAFYAILMIIGGILFIPSPNIKVE